MIRIVAANSRSKATRAYELGWKPTGPVFEDVAEEDIFEALKAFSGDNS